MGILQSMRHGFATATRDDAGGSQGRTSDSGVVQTGEAQAIAQRQDRFVGTMDEIAALAAEFSRLAPLVEQLRQPMSDEFESYRRAHSEIAYLQSHTANIDGLLCESRASESALRQSAVAQEEITAQARLENEQLRLSSEAATLEIIQQRDALSRANASAKELAESLQSASVRSKQLEEDGSTLRAQIDQAAERRRELDSIVARVRQEALLSSEESATLRRKVEELAEQLARAARSEGQAQSEATKERERALNHRAEAERAQTDLAAMAQKMDEQASVARQEIAGLATRLETLTARSGKLDRIVSELNAKLGDGAAERRAAEGRASDLQLALDRTHERAEHLEKTVAEQRSGQETLDRARLAALERGDQLALSLRTQEIALQRSDQRLAMLQDKHTATAAEMEQLRRTHDDERSRLTSEMKRLEAELNLLRSKPAKSGGAKLASDEEVAAFSGVG